jgi:starch phosphorylase
MQEFDKKEFKKNVEEYLGVFFRKPIEDATRQQVYQGVAYTVKNMIIDDWLEAHKAYEEQDLKTVYYLSMEFLVGRALGNMITNLKADSVIREALEEMDCDLETIEDEEPDAALGNGGLGRLAACFLDSLSTLGYPAYGCGIRYKYGMFEQKIEDGYQVEVPDNWLKNGNPFEIKRSEYATTVKFGGYVRMIRDEYGNDRFIQENYQSVRAIPYTGIWKPCGEYAAYLGCGGH